MTQINKLWLLEDWSVNRFYIFLFSIFILNKRFSFFVADNLEIHVYYIKTLMYYREKNPFLRDEHGTYDDIIVNPSRLRQALMVKSQDFGFDLYITGTWSI